MTRPPSPPLRLVEPLGPADPPRLSGTSRRKTEREETDAGTHGPGSPATRSAPGAAAESGASGGANTLRPPGPAERLADALGYIPTPEAIALVAGWDVDRVRWLLSAVEEGRT